MFEIAVVNGQLQLDDNTAKELQAFKEFQIQKQEWDNFDKEFREILGEAMDRAGIEKIEVEGIGKFTRTKQSVRRIADTQKLKDDGLYDLYTKESIVKPSVKVTFDD